MQRSTAARLCALALLAAFSPPLAPAQPPAEPTPATWPLAPTGLRPDDHFQVTARASERLLTVELRLDDGWHMYARDTGGGVPVRVEILDGSSFEAAGELVTPPGDDGQIHGKATLTLALRRKAPGRALRVRLSYMICDALMCLPPGSIDLTTAERQPLRVLIVTTEDATRTARIETFLAERGVRCTFERYGAVSAATCDAHDVVVADSPNADEATWKATAKLGKEASDFPRTRSPIVAVGYLGTRLLEAQKIAMASGYI